MAACCAIVIFFATAVAFILPLTQAFIPISSQSSFSTLSSTSSVKSLFRIAAFTLFQATASSLLALVIGLIASYFISHKDFPLRNLLSSSSAIPLSIPPLIMALGYVGFFGMNGSLNKAFAVLFHTDKKLSTFLYSVKGIIIAQGFYNFPLVMSTIADTWSHLSLEQKEAAELLGASKIRIFFTITLHQLFSAIASSIIPVFLYCFFSFLIVLLFGGVGTTTLEVELFSAARNSIDLRSASYIAIIETLIASFIVTLYSLLDKNAFTRLNNTASSAQKREKIQKKELPLFFLFFTIIFLFFASPLLNIAAAAFPNFSLAVMKKVLFSKGFLTALLHTFQTGCATAFFCVITAFTYAVFLRNMKKEVVFLKTFAVLPMAVSSVVIGFGITKVVQNGSPLLLVAAQTALIFPLAFRQIYASLATISKEALDAAVLLSPCKTDTIFFVYLKSSKRAIISAFILCFAASSGDTTLPLVLAIPSFDTLALFTYRLASSYRYAQASASGLLLGILCIILFALGNSIKEKK